MTIFTRDGTVTDLAIEMRLASELPPELEAAFDAHIAQHAACRARFEAARGHRDAFDLPIPAQLEAAITGPNLPPTPANTTRWFVVAAASLAAVAAVTLLVLAWPATDGGPDDLLALRGGGLRLEVVLDDGSGGQVLADDDVVHPDDRLGFRVQTAHDGWLLVAGLDQTATLYAGFPSGGTHAEPFSATEAPVALPGAIRLDGTLGTERLIAVHCARAFTLAEVERAVAAVSTDPSERLPVIFADCVQDQLVLHKEAR